MGLVLLLERVIRNSRPNHWNFKNLRSSFGREFPPPQVQGPCWFSLPPQRPFCISTCDARRMKPTTKQDRRREEEEKSSRGPETDTKSLSTVNEPLVQVETSPTSLGVLTCAFFSGGEGWKASLAPSVRWAVVTVGCSCSCEATRQRPFLSFTGAEKRAPWVGKDELEAFVIRSCRTRRETQKTLGKVEIIIGHNRFDSCCESYDFSRWGADVLMLRLNYGWSYNDYGA